MSAPAVKPALPAPSGAQAPRVGSGAPNTTPSGTPPGSATAPQKLPPSPVGVSMSVSPVKPPIPSNANHAVSATVPLSLVQEHKTQGNALPQPPVALPRTSEKPKDLVPPMAPPPGPKPTSNGVEGSPGKAPLPTVQLPPAIAESKKTEDAVSATAMLNHSADSAVPASAAGPTSAPASTPASNSSVPPLVPSASVAVSSNATILPPTHSPATSSQQSTAKPEVVSVTAAASGVPPAAVPPTPALPPAVIPPKSSPVIPATNSSSPTKSETPPGPLVAESKPTAAPTVSVEDTAPAQPPAAPASGPGPGAVPAPAPAPETVAKPAPPAPPEVTKTRIEISKPEFKVATTPRVSKRKRETKPLVEAKAASGDPNDDRKSKRVRTRTQPYQSPLPELQYREIAKIKNMIKGTDDKLIVFYKNEFLAVRNAEGSFYVCQAMQNIYKSSTRIRIRWLSQDKKDNKDTNVYIPDFYDVTEFDCILTNLELKKLDKNKYQLPQVERDRTQNILKRALDVEKGVGEKPPITEEHPDGLDLSLFRDEAQLKKKKRGSPKASKKAKKAAAKASKEGKADEGDPETSEESQGEAASGESEEDGGSGEKKKANKPLKSKANKKEKVAVKATGTTKEKRKLAGDKDGVSPKKERTSERGREREATKRRAEVPAAAVFTTSSKSTAAAKPPPEKKTKVVPTPKPARKAEKAEPAAETSLPTRATKSRSAKTAAAAIAPPPSNKTSPVTRTKERERRGVSATGGRKKPGKKA